MKCRGDSRVPGACDGESPVTRLRVLFEHAANKKLTLVSGPVGSGKTVQVACLARALESRPSCRVIWISISSPRDNSHSLEQELYEGFVRTLDFEADGSSAVVARTAGVGIRSLAGQPLDVRLLHENTLAANATLGNGDSPMPFPHTLDALLPKLKESSLRFFVIVDSSSNLSSERDGEAACWLVTKTPAQVHVMLTGRSPALASSLGISLSRLRVNDDIAEIGAGDLSLSAQEVVSFLKGQGIVLSSGDVECVCSLTRGWAMGLKMLALLLKGVKSKDIGGVIDEFGADNRYICDFLQEEMLSELDTDARAFVFATCNLEVFSETLGRAIAGQRSDEGLIARLLACGLLIKAEGRKGKRGEEWYAYHPLFVNNLRRIALSEITLASVKEAKMKAVDWYEQRELLDFAMRTSLSCGEYERAFDLMERHLYRILTSADGPKLLQWLSELSIPSHKECYVYYLVNAWANFIGGKTKRAQMWLKQAEEARPSEVDLSYYRGVEGVYRAVKVACLVFAGNHKDAIHLGVSSLENLGGPQLFLRCTIMHNLGEALERLGRYQEAYEYFARAKVNAEMSGRRTVELLCACEMSRLHLLMGDLDVSSNLLLRTLGACDEEELRMSWPCALLNAGLARVYLHWGNVEHASIYLESALKRLTPGVNRDGYLEAQVVLAQIKQMQGESEEAYDILVGAYEMLKLDKVPRGIDLLVLVTFADVLMDKGLEHRCEEVLAEAYGCMTEGDIHYRMLANMVNARLCISAGKPGEAVESLRQSCEKAEEARLNLVLQEGKAMLACIERALGNDAQALATMAEALQGASNQGQIHAFCRSVPYCRSLVFSIAHPSNDNLVLSVQREAARSFATVVLDFFGDSTDAENMAASRLSAFWGEVDGTTALSEREVQVFMLLKQGKTRKEIAAELGIRMNTVRTHIRNIYKKIGVRNPAYVEHSGEADRF